MKHYDFVTAIKLRDFYKEKIIGLSVDKEINIPIIGVIACLEGTQQKCVENNMELDIDDESITSEQRMMKVYAVVAYGSYNNEYLFIELDKALEINGLQQEHI